MNALIKRLLIGICASVLVVAAFLVLSFATGFRMWPWQRHWTYADGTLGIKLGSTKPDVWARVAQLQSAGVLDTIGRNNDSRVTTDAFYQVHNLDDWSFVMPPCCRCSLELTFENGLLSSFAKHCNYAPEFP